MLFLLQANEILQFGKKFTAAEAKEWGFVTDVYKPEELKSVLLPKLQKMKNTLVQAVILSVYKCMGVFPKFSPSIFKKKITKIQELKFKISSTMFEL